MDFLEESPRLKVWIVYQENKKPPILKLNFISRKGFAGFLLLITVFNKIINQRKVEVWVPVFPFLYCSR
jgi:hypothetical protein